MALASFAVARGLDEAGSSPHQRLFQPLQQSHLRPSLRTQTTPTPRAEAVANPQQPLSPSQPAHCPTNVAAALRVAEPADDLQDHRVPSLVPDSETASSPGSEPPHIYTYATLNAGDRNSRVF